VSSRTQLINSVRGYLRTQLLRPANGKTEARRVRKRMEKQPEGMPAMIERLLSAIEALNEQISGADEELEQIAEANPTCQRLMTVPGVGPVTSVRFVAAVDQIDRFESAHKLEAYLGLTPGEDSSSERERRTGITKAEVLTDDSVESAVLRPMPLVMRCHRTTARVSDGKGRPRDRRR
jgi:transposase